MRLNGRTRSVADGKWRLGHIIWKPGREIPHGISARLMGKAVFNKVMEQFTTFELVAVARRWGHTENNSRWRNPRPALLGFHIELAAGSPLPAPTFIYQYQAEWLLRPKIDTWIDSPIECGLEPE